MSVSVTISTNGAIKHSFIGRVTPQGEVLLPATLAIVQPDDAGATIRVRVMAFQNTRPRVLRDVRTTVPTGGRTALLRIPLNFVNDGMINGPSLPAGLVPDPVPGKLLYTDGEYAGSLVKFSSAYEASKDPRLLWNMATCEKNLRHYSKSLGLLRRYVKEGDAVLTEQDKKEADELIKVMEPFTAKLQINVDEPGAEVTLDDEAIGKSPVDPVVVDIGTRKVRIHKDEFEEFSKELPVGGAAQVSVDVKLVKIVHEGRLVVKTSNDATIAIDDKVVGSGQWAGALPSGGHTLEVTAPKMRVYQTEVLIQDKQSRDVAVMLEPEPSKGLPAWAWIGGGVLLAGGLVTGGYFIFKQSLKYEGPDGNLSPGVVQANAPIHFR